MTIEGQSRRSRAGTIALLSVGSLGLLGTTAGLAHYKTEATRLVAELTGEKDLRARWETSARDLMEQFKKTSTENKRLRKEIRFQDEVVEMQTKARKAAEAEVVKQRKRADEAEKKAAEETKRADAAEEKATRESERANALEADLLAVKQQEAEASRKNRGDAIRELEKLERKLPRHAEELEGEERARWLQYDCSVLARLKYDLNDGRDDETRDARDRRDALEARFSDACAEAQ